MGVLLVGIAVAAAALFAMRPASAWAAEDPGVGRERRLLDERNTIDGRLRTLDRQLDQNAVDRMRVPGPGAGPGGVRGPGSVRGLGDPDDPVTKRLELERRGLEDQRRSIDDRLRQDGR